MRRYFITGTVILLCVVLGAGWWVSRATPQFSEWPRMQDDAVSSSTPAEALPLKPPRTAPAGYIEYRNERYRFALFYPDNLKVGEYDEGGGAITITFQDVATAEGFQVFVVPYAGTQVGEERFRQDVPSGVREKPLDITIDGAKAVSFYSQNVALGDTAEIWFIRGGYLVEVATLKPLALWLTQIMGSWQFL